MTVEKRLPSISVLIPTLNAASVLDGCLKSVVEQSYPKKKIEIIIADGGSTDETLEIARKYNAKIFDNPLKTGEAGKAVAFQQARGELVALIDSDNILPEKNWFKKMTEPFKDPEVVGSEPWEFSYREEDGFIDRYCAMMGLNDPYCFFLGNYDRLNTLTTEWTNLEIEQQDMGKWIKIKINDIGKLPTIGANGAIYRKKEIIKNALVNDYLFDIDILTQLAEKRTILYAKVKIGIVHLYCGKSISKFIRKQERRVKDYLYFKKTGVRKYPWERQNKHGLVKFILSCLTIIPIFLQTLRGYFKKRDIAWFFHPLACWLTFAIYGKGMIMALITVNAMSRKKWKQ